MFGLYPAGQQWTRVFDTKRLARDVQRDLTAFAGFTAGVFHEPFGASRGAVFAVKDGFLALVNADNTQIAVVPDIPGQYLLWSDQHGLKEQWSKREVAAITGYGDWPDYLAAVRHSLSSICDAVQQAIDNTLSAPSAPPHVEEPIQRPITEPSLDNPDDAIWEANQAASDAEYPHPFFDHP